MVIRIDIASAFEGGIPLSERAYLSDPHTNAKSAQEPSPLDHLEVTDLAKIIFEKIRLRLAPQGCRPTPLHPALKAALAHDVKTLASFLLRSTGSKYRSLLDLKNILDLRFALADQLPVSKYEPYLKSQGYDDTMARIVANLAVRIGRQTVEMTKCRRSVVAAIRSLSDSKCRKATAKKKAIFLLDASRNCSAVETLFYEVNKSPDEFMRALRAIADSGEIHREQIGEMILEILPALKTSRGPKPSIASATHEFLLQQLGRAYTWDEEHGDFRDPFTEAARGQFSDPCFSPRAAQRRVRARRRLSSQNA
jgi:hypothetical protein